MKASREQPGHLRTRGRLLLGALAAVFLLVVGRAFQLQVLEADRWAARAVAQQQERRVLAAPRGGVFDRHGVPLALSRETFRLAVAPRELRSRERARAVLRDAAGMSAAEARRATATSKRWVVVRRSFSAGERRRIPELRGFHWERRVQRYYPQGEIGRELLGSVGVDGRPMGGLEQELDVALRGVPGYSVLRRDARGRSEPTLSLPVVAPTAGADVQLTLDFVLQEIADLALRHALRATGASGGDLLIADPHSGDLLAAVSRRKGHARSLAAASEPYEPGSTLKPFLLAALLAEERVSLSETVDCENGAWLAGNGRVVHDVHPYGRLTVGDALRVSSNVAMAKLASRLPPGEQFGYLRDFGFGTPTGIDYPAESAGRLPAPRRWSRLTPVSLAMGYEVAVTPLQMLYAYGALANGGTLMAPRLVREVRTVEGETIASAPPQAVRRVVPAEVAGQLRDVLTAVVEDGTAQRAALATFAVAGKTGTARRTGPGGRYLPGSYTASFVGYFPANDPLFVILVKLDEPRGEFYGGAAAAPVTRETLRAILAARSSGLGGRGISRGSGLAAADAADQGGALPTGGGAYVFDLAIPAEVGAEPRGAVAVPRLAGRPFREAAHRLHGLGLHVRLAGKGPVRATRPDAGTSLAVGDTVTLVGKVE
ncbi:MAG: penicillin-binding transpeptidase domain-containing protein [Longimicrobiaceae bacterium]